MSILRKPMSHVTKENPMSLVSLEQLFSFHGKCYYRLNYAQLCVTVLIVLLFLLCYCSYCVIVLIVLLFLLCYCSLGKVAIQHRLGLEYIKKK